jgi:hypothetical protein
MFQLITSSQSSQKSYSQQSQYCNKMLISSQAVNFAITYPHIHILADSCHIRRTIVDLALARRLLRLLSESGRQLLAAFTRAHHASHDLSWK